MPAPVGIDELQLLLVRKIGLANRGEDLKIGSGREDLKRLDPQQYSKVDLAITDRVIHAAGEYVLMTGRPYSELRYKCHKKTRQHLRPCKIGLTR